MADFNIHQAAAAAGGLVDVVVVIIVLVVSCHVLIADEVSTNFPNFLMGQWVDILRCGCSGDKQLPMD